VFIEPSASHDELVAEITKMGDRSAKRGETKPKEDGKYLPRAAVRHHRFDRLPLLIHVHSLMLRRGGLDVVAGRQWREPLSIRVERPSGLPVSIAIPRRSYAALGTLTSQGKRPDKAWAAQPATTTTVPT
jgi:hypothetical protein